MFMLGTQVPGINYTTNNLTGGVLGQGPLGPLPYILVLPKPAGPRRVLTAIHTAINVPVLDHSYSPIATAPTSPAPTLRHFSEEINPMDIDQIVIDPVSNQAFAARPPVLHSTQSSPGCASPNNGLLQDQQPKPDLVRQLMNAAGNQSTVIYPFDHAAVEMLSPSTPGSVGSPTGILVPGTAGQPAGIQFDPTARPPGALSPALTGLGFRRVSTGGTRLPASGNEGGTVVIPPINGAQNHQPFALIQRMSETTQSTNYIRMNDGRLLRQGAGRSPLAITQSNGLVFSPPPTRSSSTSSPVPRSDPAATRNGGNGNNGSSASLSIDGSKSVLPPSPLPVAPPGLIRTGSSNPGMVHAASPPPHDAVSNRGRASNPGKKAKDTKASEGVPSLVKSGVVERVSPLVNVLIVEGKPWLYSNALILF